MLFQEVGIRVQSPSMYERDTHSGTEIRHRMLANKPWKTLVPPAVVKVIEEIDGVGRLRRIAQDD